MTDIDSKQLTLEQLKQLDRNDLPQVKWADVHEDIIFSLISPDEDRRQEVTRKLRKGIFSDVKQGSKTLEDCVQRLHQEEDYNNFLKFVTRDKGRQSAAAQMDWTKVPIQIIREVISPDNSKRKQISRDFRKKLVANKGQGKNILIAFMEKLEFSEDYDNFIKFVIRDKQRKSLFGLFNKKDVQDSLLGTSPENQSFKEACIRALVSNDDNMRSWIGRSLRKSLDYSPEMITQIFLVGARVESSQLLMDTITFFARDEKRRAALIQSGLLNVALDLAVQNNPAQEEITLVLKKCLANEFQQINSMITRKIEKGSLVQRLQAWLKAWFKKWKSSKVKIVSEVPRKEVQEPAVVAPSSASSSESRSSTPPPGQAEAQVVDAGATEEEIEEMVRQVEAERHMQDQNVGPGVVKDAASSSDGRNQKFGFWDRPASPPLTTQPRASSVGALLDNASVVESSIQSLDMTGCSTPASKFVSLSRANSIFDSTQKAKDIEAEQDGEAKAESRRQGGLFTVPDSPPPPDNPNAGKNSPGSPPPPDNPNAVTSPASPPLPDDPKAGQHSAAASPPPPDDPTAGTRSPASPPPPDNLKAVTSPVSPPPPTPTKGHGLYDAASPPPPDSPTLGTASPPSPVRK